MNNTIKTALWAVGLIFGAKWLVDNVPALGGLKRVVK